MDEQGCVANGGEIRGNKCFIRLKNPMYHVHYNGGVAIFKNEQEAMKFADATGGKIYRVTQVIRDIDNKISSTQIDYKSMRRY
mgnify:CR=1 FL=1